MRPSFFFLACLSFASAAAVAQEGTPAAPAVPTSSVETATLETVLVTGEQRALVQGEIAAAFRGVFLLVASFSCTIVAMAWTLPVRRL